MHRRTMIKTSAAAAALHGFPVQADPLADGSFAQHVIALLAAAHPDWTVVPGDDPLSLRIGSVSVSLRNIALQVQQLPADQRDPQIVAFIEHGLAPALDGTATFDTVRPALRVQLEPLDYLQTVPTIVHTEFMAGLMSVYAVDQEYRYATVLQPQFDSWHLPRATVEQAAVANLQARADQLAVEPARHTGGGTYYTSNVADGYDAARLLLPGFMTRVRQALGTPTVFAAIPNRDFLVAWTPDFSKRTAFAALVTRDIHIQPHPLTDALFVVSEQGTRLADATELADHGR